MRRFIVVSLWLVATPCWADTLILDTATRVAKRVTVDDPAPHDPTTESVVTKPEHWDLSSCPCKLSVDNRTLVPATTQEVQEAEKTVRDRQREALVAQMDDILASGVTNARVRELIRRWRELYTP
jgi:hypothetical protein